MSHTLTPAPTLRPMSECLGRDVHAGVGTFTQWMVTARDTGALMLVCVTESDWVDVWELSRADILSIDVSGSAAWVSEPYVGAMSIVDFDRAYVISRFGTFTISDAPIFSREV